MVDANKIKTEKETLELAKKLIKQNLQNPLSFHIQNLETNHKKISNIKIKIILYIKNKKQCLPLFHILLTSKNQIIYNHIFRFIKQILIDNSIECDFSEKIITRDLKNH